MSLVGTRPILQDELRQYELHHRARIAIKPGITSAVLVGTIHVIQGIYINWREPAFSSVVCKQKVCLTTKRRMAKEMQVVGGPNSTDEGMNKINTRGKSRENC